MRWPAPRVRLTERQESPARIEALTDGIFSVAMTLLVLGLALDQHEQSAQTAQHDLWQALEKSAMGWKFLWFLASFVVTGFFWVGHLLMLWTIDRIDRIVVWLNVIFFVPIVLVPFTTILVGQFPHATLAGSLYMLDVLAAAISLDSVWFYSVRKGLVAKGTPPDLEKAISRRLIFVTGLLMLACGLAPFFPYYAIGAVLITMFYIIATTGTRLLVD